MDARKSGEKLFAKHSKASPASKELFERNGAGVQSPRPALVLLVA